MLSAKNALIELLNREEILTSTEFTVKKTQFEGALSSFEASRLMKDGDNNYLVYDDFEKNNAGSRPYTLSVLKVLGEPDGNVYKEGDRQYLALRAFRSQAVTQALSMGYMFDQKIEDGKLVFAIGFRFNEARWADILRVYNENQDAAIVVAIERVSDTESAIVAYNGSSKKVLATYTPNEWTEIRVEADIDRSAYHIYINGSKANEITFRFRNKSDALTGVSFGVLDANTDLNIDYIKVYQEN